MSSFIKPTGKCCYNIPIQSPIIYPEKNHTVFGNNLIGADGWPASRPNQSNMGYINGLSGFRPPNGTKRYLYTLTAIEFDSGNIQYVPHFTTFRLKTNSNPSARTYLTYVEDDPYKYMVLAKYLKSGDDIELGTVTNRYNVITNSLDNCCACNKKC